MSLYGNIKKVGSSTFQFDRVYQSRCEMEQKKKTDGVYAGRYILIEYGERYIKISSNNDTNDNEENTENNGINLQDDSILHTPNEEITNSTDESTIEENPIFIKNKKDDLDTYGAVYDSTVWQKVFTNDGDKYIMVAELNGSAPKINLIRENPIKYIKTDDMSLASDITAGSIENGSMTSLAKITNAIEEYNEAYFDTAISNELEYTLHLPKPLELKADNDQIDFNEKGFNMVYSYGEKDGVSGIAWIPDPDNFDYTTKNNDNTEIGTDEATGNKLGRVTQDQQEIDSKTLFMSFPAIGNMMNTLYDLLYGKPVAEDLTTGVVRPYFADYLPDTRKVNVMVWKTSTMELVPLQIYESNGDIRTKTVEGAIGSLVNVNVQNIDLNKTIIPDNIIIVHKENNGVYTRYENSVYTSDLFFAYTDRYYDNNGDMVVVSDLNDMPDDAMLENRIVIIQTQIPVFTGDTDQDMEWLKSVPEIAELLENNTSGLATVLQNLFGYRNPFTGTTRYYLYSDWRNKEGKEYSDPAIANKPEVVGGYSTSMTSVQNMYQLSSEDTPELVTEADVNINYATGWSDGDYYIDYSTWTINNYLANKYDDNIINLRYISQDDIDMTDKEFVLIHEQKIYEGTWSGMLQVYRLIDVENTDEESESENELTDISKEIIKITFSLLGKGMYGSEIPLEKYCIKLGTSAERDIISNSNTTTTGNLIIEASLQLSNTERDAILGNQMLLKNKYTIPMQLFGYKNGKIIYLTDNQNIDINLIFSIITVDNND